MGGLSKHLLYCVIIGGWVVETFVILRYNWWVGGRDIYYITSRLDETDKICVELSSRLSKQRRTRQTTSAWSRAQGCPDKVGRDRQDLRGVEFIAV